MISRVAIAVLWTCVIMLLCWLPKHVVLEVEGDAPWFRIPHFDKVVHAGIFVVFSVFWVRVGSTSARFAWVLLGGLALAVLTELVQNLPVIGREASFADGLADCAATIVGISVAPLVEPLLRSCEARLFRESSAATPIARTDRSQHSD
jgi:VanZ family protein